MHTLKERSSRCLISGNTEVMPQDGDHDVGAQVKLSTAIQNYCGEDIVVATRIGLNFRLPATSIRSHLTGVHCKLGADVKSGVKVYRQDILHELPSSREERIGDVMHSSYCSAGYKSNQLGLVGTTLRGSCIVTKERLLANGGSLYLRDLDLVIALAKYEEHPNHPMSVPEDILRADPDSVVTATFRLIDNEGVIGPKFLNLNGEVFQIRRETSTELISGLYYTSPIVYNERTKEENIKKTTYFTPEELNATENRVGVLKFVFNDFDSASCFGDAIVDREKRQKIELVEAKSELTKRAAELEETKRDLALAAEKQALQKEEMKLNEEKHKSALDKQKREIEHRNQMESMDRKDYYENRSYVRKDSSEWLKYVPALISLSAALIPLLRG